MSIPPHFPAPRFPGDTARTLRRIRDQRPLVHCIGNAVVLNPIANALLALGASPAVVDAEEESAVLAARAGALAINLGTVSAPQARAMEAAAAAAGEHGVPWVLDPVAVGILPFRTGRALALLRHRPAAIRGNASEILALEAALSEGSSGAISGASSGTPAGAAAVSGHGVDAAHAPEDARPAAIALSARTGAAVSVSGDVDTVVRGARRARINNGHAMMTRVTGMGCTATALLAACSAVEPDPFAAAVDAAVIGGIAGEHAAARARGPGSLQLEFLDALWRLDAVAIERDARIAMDAGSNAATV